MARAGDEEADHLVAGTRHRDPIAELTPWLPALVEIAGIVAAVLGAGLRSRGVEAGRIESVNTAIATKAFRTVFQPIIHLRSGECVGYEALTRFDDGRAADVWFAEAHSLGLGMALELATLERALASARPLPVERSLHINVSASTVGTAAFRDALVLAGRELVIEITEHEAVSDYQAFRSWFSALAGGTKLCVDDAGSGFASLRHVVELAPDIVKLDRSLVMNVDRDKARQAAVAGMAHFAVAADIQLVAEGIERDEELQCLRFLGVPLGQGYLLGRPAPLPNDPTVALQSMVTTSEPRRRRDAERVVLGV